MPKKKFAPGQTHGFIGDKPKYKPKPITPFIDTLLQYKLERDRVIYKTTNNEKTKQDILEKYGKANSARTKYI